MQAGKGKRIGITLKCENNQSYFLTPTYLTHISKNLNNIIVFQIAEPHRGAQQKCSPFTIMTIIKPMH